MNQFWEDLFEIFESASRQMTKKEFQQFANNVISTLCDDYDVKERNE